MRHTKTITITQREYEHLQSILDIEDNIDEQYEEGTYKTFSAEFDDGRSIDVKLCIGQNNAYIDAILFSDDGYEIIVLEPDWTLLGEYEFEYQGTTYILELAL